MKQKIFILFAITFLFVSECYAKGELVKGAAKIGTKTSKSANAATKAITAGNILNEAKQPKKKDYKSRGFTKSPFGNGDESRLDILKSIVNNKPKFDGKSPFPPVVESSKYTYTERIQNDLAIDTTTELFSKYLAAQQVETMSFCLMPQDKKNSLIALFVKEQQAALPKYFVKSMSNDEIIRLLKKHLESKLLRMQAQATSTTPSVSEVEKAEPKKAEPKETEMPFIVTVICCIVGCVLSVWLVAYVIPWFFETICNIPWYIYCIIFFILGFIWLVYKIS